MHEVTSPQAFDGLRAHEPQLRLPGSTWATMDHNVTTPPRTSPPPLKMALIQMGNAGHQLQGVRGSSQLISTTNIRGLSM
ncbi:hypothetical protein ACLK19_00555 [Escherichia coli]